MPLSKLVLVYCQLNPYDKNGGQKMSLEYEKVILYHFFSG